MVVRVDIGTWQEGSQLYSSEIYDDRGSKLDFWKVCYDDVVMTIA